MKTTTRRHFAAGFGVLAAAGVLSACATGGQSTPAASQVKPTAAAPGAANAGTHTDGTYSATGTYTSPAGNESIEVSLTLASDVITGVSVKPQATDPNAAQFQKRFASGVSAVVVGKNIGDVKVGAVSGSSLTGAGFNEALETIATQSLK